MYVLQLSQASLPDSLKKLPMLIIRTLHHLTRRGMFQYEEGQSILLTLLLSYIQVTNYLFLLFYFAGSI